MNVLGKHSTMELYPQFFIIYLFMMLGNKPRALCLLGKYSWWTISNFYLFMCLFLFVCWAPTPGPCAYEAGTRLLSFISQSLWDIINNTTTNIRVHLLRHQLSILFSVCLGAAFLDHTVIPYSVFLKNHQALFHGGWAQNPFLLPCSISATHHSWVFFFFFFDPKASSRMSLTSLKFPLG